MSNFTRFPWELEWKYLGEGYNGDYNGQAPDDKPLLRASLYYGGKPCRDGSCCTFAPVGTPSETLRKFSDDLFSRLEDGVKNDPDFVDWETTAADRFDEVGFKDRVMQDWAWTTRP